MPFVRTPHAHGDVSTLSWGLFLAIALSAVFVALGIPGGPIAIALLVLATLFAYRSIYATFYVAIALTPFLGFLVVIPTGALEFGARAFGGAIDITVAEAIYFFVIGAWALKLFFLWWQRHDRAWHPRLPMLASATALTAAHLLSVFSPLEPDPLPTIKFAFRPILFNYLAFIALPINLIRSRRRLATVLGIIAVVGTIAALNGLVAMFFPTDSGAFIGRAHPYPIFGVNALGENHNSLAEILVTTSLATFALAVLATSPRAKRLAVFAGAFQVLIGLLTFTRTAWIVFGLQTIFLGCTVYREEIRRHLSKLMIAAALLLPLGLAMVAYSLSMTAQSSNSTRLALSQIAFQLFQTSPWVGSGAGTFVDRVGSAQVFFLEYGSPLDSHGVIQKLAAETGIVGLLAFAFFLGAFGYHVYQALRSIHLPHSRQIALLLAASAWGGIVYQFFNTSYWTGKMWLPIGIALAAFEVLRDPVGDPGMRARLRPRVLSSKL
jgi:O-antigen ligase